MAIIDITSNDKGYKYFAKNVRSISKVRLKREPKLYYTKEKKGRSGRGLGRFHEITELFFDSDNRLFVGYKTKDESGHFYQYAIVGRLLTQEEEEAI